MPTFRITSPDGRVFNVTGPEGSTAEQALEKVKAQAGEPAAPPADERPELQQRMTNLAGGAIRGAGSIGATLMAPIDIARDALAGKGLTLESNRQRRQGMDSALQGLGIDTDSAAYGAGKLGGEIAGTLGAGGAIANVAGAVPGVAAAAPNVLQAIRTSGMSGGNALTRAAGGAVTGGAAAGLVDPESAGMGAMIGGAAPGALQLAGKVGNKVGGVIRGPQVAPDLAAAAGKAQAAGYVIPPTQVKPSLGNRMLEGFAGKITTAQNASARNQAVTNKVAAQAIGLPADVKLTPDVLKSVRDQAGQAYQAIGQAGVIQPGAAYTTALDKIASPHLTAAAGFPSAKVSPVVELVDSLRSTAFDSASAVAKIKELRSAADDAFRAGNTDVARASRAASTALEDAIEAHLTQSGATDLLTQFRDARQLIAKTYSVEKAMNPATGSIDARKLGQQLAKGKPLSGGLREAGEFGLRFPKAAQAIEGMGSLPQTSPLDWAAMGTISAATSNPLMMAGVLARPAARSAVLSGPVQNRLTTSGANPLARLADPELRQMLLRAAPVAGAGR